MKPFDLEKALAGAKVVTRYGREVKNLRRTSQETYPSDCALYGGIEDHQYAWCESGSYWETCIDDRDLFLADEEPAFDTSKLKVGDRVRLRNGSVRQIDDVLPTASHPFALRLRLRNLENGAVGWWYANGRADSRNECELDIIGYAPGYEPESLRQLQQALADACVTGIGIVRISPDAFLAEAINTPTIEKKKPKPALPAEVWHQEDGSKIDFAAITRDNVERFR